jgi:ribonucleotide reductase alpha subunit
MTHWRVYANKKWKMKNDLFNYPFKFSFHGFEIRSVYKLMTNKEIYYKSRILHEIAFLAACRRIQLSYCFIKTLIYINKFNNQ